MEFRILANRRDHDSIIEEAKKHPDPGFERRDKRWWWAEVDRRRPCVDIGSLPLDQGSRVTVFGMEQGQVCVLQYRHTPQAEAKTYVLIVRDKQNVTGDLLSHAEETVGSAGLPCVGFTFNSVGAGRFRDLTRANQPADDGFMRRLGILLDNTVMSAPVIKAVIGASGVIEGGVDGFEPEELANLIAILNGGRLPCRLEHTGTTKADSNPQQRKP